MGLTGQSPDRPVFHFPGVPAGAENVRTNDKETSTMHSIEVGDRVTGDCVTMNIRYTGTVAEIIAPVPYSGCSRPRYRLVDTERHYSSGRPIEPIVERASRS